MIRWNLICLHNLSTYYTSLALWKHHVNLLLQSILLATMIIRAYGSKAWQ